MLAATSVALSFVRYSAVVLSVFILSACTTAPSQSVTQELHIHTESLADSLFASGDNNQQIQRVGIGSIVPVHSLRHEGNSRDRIIVQQVQEGLIGALTQRGARVVEYRTSNQLRLESDQELMLSREIEELSTRQHLDYFLTGTYSEVSGGLLVNVRLINVQDNSVQRAATQFFPWTSLVGSGEHSEIRHDQLYRNARLKPESPRRDRRAPLGASR